MSSSSPSPSWERQVREQLDRLLADDRFARSQALSRFLRYTVEETLEGRGDTLKEYLVGFEGLGKGSNFDPRIDPIVRVQARKLRARLEKYYAADGAADPITIEYPKGGYIPSFRLRETAPAEPEPASACAPASEAATTPAPAIEPSGEPEPTGKRAAAPRTPAARRKPSRVWLGVAAGAAAILVVWIAVRFWPFSRRAPNIQLLSLQRLTYDAGSATFPAISADGKWVAFASDRGGGNLDIWMQPVRGGNAIRLSSHPAADITPDLSPEGTQVVFRSHRDGGGLYLVSVLGGPERRIADAGWHPRFSPDGGHIAFQGVSGRRGGDLYIVATGGGEPRRLDIGKDIELGGYPMWTPDGARLLFLGSDLRHDRVWDWWLVPKEGGAPVSAGLADLLIRQGLPPPDIHTTPGDWALGGAVASLPREQTANLWLISFDPAARRFSGQARQITFGTGHESLPRFSRTGLLAFVSESQNSHLYSIPRQPSRTPPEPVRLTNDLALDPGFFRALTRFSASERHLLFPSRRLGNPDVFVKDLMSGVESAVIANPGPEDQPLLAPDQSHVVYRARESGASPLYLARLGAQVARKVCDDCGEPDSWTSDGRRLLYTGRGGLGILEVETGRKSEIYRQPGTTPRHADLSPDQRRLALTLEDPASRGERAFLIDFTGERLPPQDQWTEILQNFGVESLHWAPDGSALYFFATRDDFRCLWLQPVGRDGRPSAAPSVLAHFHGRPSPWSSWLAVTRHRVIFSLTQPVSSLWTAQVASSR